MLLLVIYSYSLYNKLYSKCKVNKELKQYAVGKGREKMKKDTLKLTTAQFAKLHEVNKRTLHYYDSIGLFPPRSKGDNNYRYYDGLQSIDFEYIRMLKELNMSIEEISAYRNHPNPDEFIKIAENKIKEIETQIQKLRRTKKILQNKKDQIEFCNTIQEQEIQVVQCKEEKILVAPYRFEEDDMPHLFSYAKDVWGIEQCRMGIGSYIAVDKVRNNYFEEYEGLFTPALKMRKGIHTIVKPGGRYLWGYQKGLWENLPVMYRKLIDYAKQHHFKLTGYAYEMGMNDFVITDERDYITRIMIKIEDETDKAILK